MKEHFRRRHLPHWDVPGATYFVTACLAGSIPAQGVLDIRNLEQRLANQKRPLNLSDQDWGTQKWKLIFARRDEWLDLKPAVRHFDDEQLAAV
jgi:hypothetical protein